MSLYSPVQPNQLAPGLPGNDPLVDSVLSAPDKAYVEWNPTIFLAGVSVQLQSTDDEYVLDFPIPGNPDNLAIALDIVWRAHTAEEAACYFEITDGISTDDAMVTTTGATFVTSTITVTPSNSTMPANGTPRYGKVRMICGGTIAQLVHVHCRYAATSFPAGIQPSGCTTVGEHWFGSNQPINSELVARGHNNIRNLAKSRPAFLAGGANRFDRVGIVQPPGPHYTWNASGGADTTQWKLIERWIQPGSDDGRRPYLLSVKISGDDPEVRMVIGPHAFYSTVPGWTFETPILALSEGMPCSIFMRSSSGGNVQLETWSIHRAGQEIEVYPALTHYLACDGSESSYGLIDIGEASPFQGSGWGIRAFSFWFRGASASPVQIFDLSTDGTPTMAALANAGMLATWVHDDAGTLGAEADIAQTMDGEWHHCFITTRETAPTYGSEGLQVWVDSVSVADSMVPVVLATVTTQLRLFQSAGGLYGFEGSIAGFSVFNHLPNPYEILSLANAPLRQRHDPRNQVGYWKGYQPLILLSNPQYYDEGYDDGAYAVDNLGSLPTRLILYDACWSEEFS